ncbi:MAG: hypothetical protein ACKVS9_17390 [Phycisphaerae bacterium]
MRWGAFSAALLVTLILQKTVLWVLHAPAIDLFLTLAVLCALCAPAYDARIACWLIGLVQDLGTDPAALGSNALALGACGMMITFLRDWVQTRDWWMRLAISLLCAWPAQIAVALYDRLWVGHGVRSGAELVGWAALTSIIACALAVFVAAQPWFGISRSRGSRMARR